MKFDFIKNNKDLSKTIETDVKKLNAFINRMSANKINILEQKAFLGKRNIQRIEALIA